MRYAAAVCALLAAAGCGGSAPPPTPSPSPEVAATAAEPAAAAPAPNAANPDAQSAYDFVRAYAAAARARDCERLADMSDVESEGRRAAELTPEQLQKLAPDAAQVMRDLGTDARGTLVKLCSQGAMNEWRTLGDADLAGLTPDRADGSSADLTMYLRLPGGIQKQSIHLTRQGDGSWRVDLAALNF